MDDLLDKKYESGISVVVADETHIDHIADNLRTADRLEIGLVGSQPREGLSLGVEFDDETYTLLTKDKNLVECLVLGNLAQMKDIYGC